jgi:gluconate kinase
MYPPFYLETKIKSNMQIFKDAAALEGELSEAKLDAAEQMVEKSRLAGKRGRWEEVVSHAKDALSTLKPAEHSIVYVKDEHSSIESRLIRCEILTVSALGYMGFGLMKQSRYNEALPLLDESIKRSSTIKSKIEQDAPTFRRLHREAIAAEKAYSLCQEEIVHVKQSPLVKYPRTAHLFDTGGTAATDDDLILPDNDAAYTVLCDGHTNVVIEEKVDGANIGISFDPLTQDLLVQNRSHYISSGEHAQFSRITEFIEEHRSALHQILCAGDYIQNGSLILYGEWLAARHSVPYHKLPGLFVAYDLFDQKEGNFFSRARFHTIMKDSGIPVAPVIGMRTFGPYTQKQKQNGLFRSELVSFLDTKSAFRNDEGNVEGVVLRVDDSESLWNQHRYKIVRPDFVRGCDGGNWSSRQIEKQRVDFEFALDYINNCYVLADSGKDCSTVNEETKETHSQCKKPPAGAISKEAREYRKQRARARRQVPRCVMLMGLPGSGKSTFANRLAASNPDNNVVINQDRLGKKKCIELACQASSKNRIILDRCNPTEAERHEWHNIVGSPSKGDCVLVYFAANDDTCTERVKNRTNHETIPEGRGERIVKSVANILEPPSNRDRNLFGTIEIVHNFEESNALLHKWGVDDAHHVE